MRVLLLVFAFIVKMPVSAHPGGHYHEAYGLASDHAFDESLASFRSIIERTPQHASAWLSIASLRLIQGDVAGARDACLRASGYVDPIAVLACHGRIALAEGDGRTAYMRLDRLLSSSAYLERSDVYTLWAVAVSAELAVMASDTERMRGSRPYVMTNLRAGDGLTDIIEFIEREGMLAEAAE